MYPFNVINWVKMVLVSGLMSLGLGAVFLGTRWRFWDTQVEEDGSALHEIGIDKTSAPIGAGSHGYCVQTALNTYYSSLSLSLSISLSLSLSLSLC